MESTHNDNGPWQSLQTRECELEMQASIIPPLDMTNVIIDMYAVP